MAGSLSLGMLERHRVMQKPRPRSAIAPSSADMRIACVSRGTGTARRGRHAKAARRPTPRPSKRPGPDGRGRRRAVGALFDALGFLEAREGIALGSMAEGAARGLRFGAVSFGNVGRPGM